MAVRARSSGTSTASASHTVPPPPGTLPGDRIVVGFVNDHAHTTASTVSPGWRFLGEAHQGTTTNHSLTIFTKAVAAGIDDDLVVDITDSGGDGPVSATWVAIALVGSGGAAIGAAAGLADGGNDTSASFLPVQDLSAGDYDSLLFLGIDNNGEPGHSIGSPPSGGWGNQTTPGSNTPDTVAYSWDRSVTGFSGDLAPGTVTWTNADQWISAHVVFPSGTGITAEGHRFYLANQDNAWGPTPAALEFWANDDAATDPQLLAGEPTGTKTSTGVAETSGSATQYTLVRQWVSLPAAAAGTIYGNTNYTIGVQESDAAANMKFAVGVWVTQGNDPTIRGQVIGADGLGVGGATEWPTTATALNLSVDDGEFPNLAGPVSFQPGDRIVVELGYVPDNTDTTEYTGTLHYGGTGSTDLVPGDTTAIDTRPAWIDLLISPGVTFEDLGVTGTAEAALGFTATASGTVIPVEHGSAAAELGFTASAAGVRRWRGTAEAALGFTAVAAGTPVPPVPGNAAAALGFTASATGIVLEPGRGSGAAALGFTAAATGRRHVTGTATAALGFTAAARSNRRTGTASAAIGFTAAATGAAIANVDGAAAATLGFTAAATGTAVSGPVGTAAAALGFTATVTGTRDANRGVPFLVDEFGPDAKFLVEIAWGADPAGEPVDWTWTDITRDVYADPGITTKMGRDDEASTSQPATCTMVLRNDHHAYSLGGHSPNWPNVKRNVPVRVQIDPDGTGYFVVFIGHADGFTPGWITTGGIPTVTLSASGAMRRILQGDAPVTSAYRRAMTELNSVVAYWPFEDGRNAAYARCERGGDDMVTATDSHEFAAGDVFDCSAPLVRLRSTPAGTFEDFGAAVDPYVVTGQTQVRFLMSIPRNGLPNGAFLADIFTTGTAGRFSLTYWDGNNEDGTPNANGELDGLHFTIWDQSNNVLHEELRVSFPVLGASLRFSVELEQDGSDIVWRVATLAPGDDTAWFIEHTLEDETVGRVESLFMGGNDVDDTILGHVTLQNQVTDFFEEADPLSAHTGEFNTGTTGRMRRLCEENGVQFTAIGSGASLSPNDTLGPQLARPLMELLREGEAADQGQLYDGLFAPGLVYSTRRYRELGTLALTIDASSAELAEPFNPLDDDQRNRNRVSATITTGVTATFEDRYGPLGTDTIGIYDDSIEANNEHDDMAIHYAAWLVHLGTVEGYRVGSVTIDLRAAPHLAEDVLFAIPGERIDITGLDQVFEGWLPGDVPLSLIIEGVGHEIGPRHWRATFRCSPFSPWGIARAAAETGDDSEYAWRLDTDGTRLVGDHTAGATSLTVSTDPAVVAADTFTRTVSNGWGTADTGGVYTVAGTAGAQVSDFAVSGGVATISVGAINRAQFAYLDGVDERDVDVAVTCTCSATDITGGQIELADVMVRGTSDTDYTYARVIVLPDQSTWLSIVEVVDSTHDELIQPLEIPGLTFTGTLRCRMQAQGHTLRARVWDPAGAEPDEWQREVTVGAARSGWVGARVAIANGVTNTLPLTFSHDDFTATTITPSGGPLWTTEADDYPLTLSVGGIPVVATGCSGTSNPQTFTVEALPLDRPDRAPVALWDPRPIGL